MHEWSLAQAVVKAATDFANKNGFKKRIKVSVLLGELQQIDKEIFTHALEEITKELKDWHITYEIKEEKAKLKCRTCGFEWNLSETKKRLSEKQAEFIHFIPDIAHSYMQCPNCKSVDFEIKKGRGLSIASVEEI